MKSNYSFFRDFTTVLWKEGKELYHGVIGPRGRLGFIVFVAVFGVILPLQTGRDWLETPVAVVSWAWLPMLIVSGVTADAIAGERERHTLETLLSSRLPDGAIYAGKIAASILYGCFQVWLMALASVIAVNAAYWDGRILFFSLPLFTAILAYPVLVGSLAAGIAALLAVGAETARQAHQVMSVISIIMVLPVFLINLLPESWKAGLLERLSEADWDLLGLAFPLVLLTISLITLFAGSRKFTRHELLRERERRNKH